VLGRAEEGSDLALVTLGPVPPATARRALADLVALRDLGLQTPLPLPVGAGEVYARLRAAGRDADAAGGAASRCWSSGWQHDGEDADPAHVLVWGEAAPWSALSAWAAPAGSLPGEPGEPTDLGRVARVVWQPLLDAESRRTL
jgi:exodeoxyribonuclease V gamma subunit